MDDAIQYSTQQHPFQLLSNGKNFYFYILDYGNRI